MNRQFRLADTPVLALVVAGITTVPSSAAIQPSARSEPAFASTADVDATGGSLWNSILGEDTTHGMQRFARLIALFILLCGVVFWLLTP